MVNHGSTIVFSEWLRCEGERVMFISLNININPFIAENSHADELRSTKILSYGVTKKVVYYGTITISRNFKNVSLGVNVNWLRYRDDLNNSFDALQDF